MSVLNKTPNLFRWWNQFPPGLRILSKIRLLASIGAGGVIYLTPLVFHQINLSATQIGTGLAAAALAGTTSRFLAGALLDEGTNSSLIVRWAAYLAIWADCCLLSAQNFSLYTIGQILLGLAAGLYWPAVELAVPSNCEKFPSSKGFALVRTADALGTSIGALLSSLMALSGAIRMTYLLDTICMIMLLRLLVLNPLLSEKSQLIKTKNSNLIKIKSIIKSRGEWLPQLLPILLLSLQATTILSLLQSALPIDLVRGGIDRPPLGEGLSGVILALQLFLLVILQWPIGRWLSLYKQSFGLTISICNFCIGTLLLGLSAIWEEGILLILIAQVPLAIALAAFLPTATEAITQATPIKYRGISMALFSQCFAISALIAPIVAGIIIDIQGNGMLVWLTMSLSCLAMLPLIGKLKTNKQRA